MRAGIYARVSTAEQAREGTSLVSQVRQCRAFVGAKGWHVAEEYVDEGVSGSLKSRPELDRMLRAVYAGDLDVVVVAKLDRFSRSLRHLVNTVPELEAAGVAFVSVAESIDGTTATGRLFRSIVGAFAEFERDRITERMLEGHQRTAEAGGWTGGPPPFGYRTSRNGRFTVLEPDEGGEADTIRLAVEMVLDRGVSCYEAAKRLNALGRGPRRAEQWRHQNLRRVLKDPALAGKWAWGRRSDRVELIEVPIPPVIEPDRWVLLQQALERTATGRRGQTRFYLLTGRLTAPCGERYTGLWRKDRQRRYYRCNGSRADLRVADGPCGCGSLVADEIEQAVWQEVAALLREPDRLLHLAATYFSKRANETSVEKGQLADVDARITNLEEAIGVRAAEALKQGFSQDMIRRAVTQLESELNALRRHRTQLAAWTEQNAAQSERMASLAKLAEGAHKRLDTMSPVERRAVLDLLDVRVDVLDSGGRRRAPKIRIEGQIPEELSLDGDLIDAAPRPSS
jgi:DNA invertase Pin-like site-specific DNA recombinase